MCVCVCVCVCNMPNQVTVVGHNDELQDFITKYTACTFVHTCVCVCVYMCVCVCVYVCVYVVCGMKIHTGT